MNHLIKCLFLIFLLNACQSNVQKIPEVLPEKAGELPVKAFASLPLIQQASLSPDGRFIAFLQNTGSETALVTQDRTGKEMHVVLTSDNQKFRFRSYDWVNNNRLLVRILYPARHGNLKVYETRLFAINRDGTEAKPDLIQIQSTLNDRKHISQFQDNFTLIPNDPRHVLISLDKRHPGAPDVYKLDVYTGETEMVAGNPGFVRSWIYDREGRVRVGIGVTGTTTIRMVQRKNSEDDWKVFAEYDGVTASGWESLGFSDDPDWLYLLANHQGKSAVFKIDLNKPASASQPELVYADPEYDVKGELIYSADQKRVIGINYIAESGKVAYWDAEALQIQQRIDNALPRLGNHIVSRRNGQYLLISSSAEFAPVYYWFDANKNSIGEVIKTYPDLKPSVLAKTETVHFKARDGLTLEGFLTRPVSSANSGPTIIFPHGGPWSRDINSFDYWTQFMVNRGWNVFRINFRGSAGYGEQFIQAGFQRWGLEMQDDITDGVNWLITGKIADPSKICIVGGSYGGYATLMGLAKTPELYRCGVSFAPVTDLVELMEDWSDMHWLDRHLRAELVEQRFGNWWSDRSRLKATSPVNLAKQIQTPLLLVHGDEDRSVDVNHSRKMASALKSAGFKDFQYIEMEDADHHLSREQDRMQFFQAMDSFLRKYQ
ncbi:S9 family peptidase [Methylomonas sp. AM2-LC]|uniref:alpha/beta hydrolase family protein n=1 Tax=Methylomonas sp. AM2-LC TaxID=3153301 RepID=UPI003264C154